MGKIPGIILVALLAFLGFEVYTKTYNPCDTPILYKIGTVDPKFGLTLNEVKTNTKEAADILNIAYGNTLFSNSDEGELTVNFVFDERSALDAEINQQVNNIDEQNNTLMEKIK